MLLPNDMLKEIINNIPGRYYFNIYCVCRFRQCLKFVYEQHTSLKTNEYDILSAMVFRNGLCYTGDQVINTIKDYSYGTIYLDPLIRVLLQFNVTYKNYIKYIMRDICLYNELKVMEYITSLNDITPYINEMLRFIYGENDKLPLYEFLFNHLLKYGSSKQLSFAVQSALTRNRYDLVDKLINTNRIADIMNIMPILIERNDITIAQSLLKGDINLSKHSYKTLIGRCESGSDMRTLINRYYPAYM